MKGYIWPTSAGCAKRKLVAYQLTPSSLLSTHLYPRLTHALTFQVVSTSVRLHRLNSTSKNELSSQLSTCKCS